MRHPSDLAKKFEALSHPTRIRVLNYVSQSGQPESNQDIAAALEVHPSTLSQHLLTLVAAGFLTRRTAGRYALFELDYEMFFLVSEYLNSLCKDSLHAHSSGTNAETTEPSPLRTSGTRQDSSVGNAGQAPPIA